VARATSFPPDGQLRHGGGGGCGDDPGCGDPLRGATGMRRRGACVLAAAALLGPPQSGAAQDAHNPFLGSVPTGEAEPAGLPVSRRVALARAPRYNLGIIERQPASRAARAVRLRNLSALLPALSARVSATRQTVNLQASGLRLNIPGTVVPIVVGPFDVTD